MTLEKFLLIGVLWCLASLSQAKRLGPPLNEQVDVATTQKGAQTLYSIHDYRLNADGFWEEHKYYSIKINDLDTARDYGRINISFNDYYFETELEFANVLSSNNKIIPVAQDAIQIRKVAQLQDFYEDRSEIAFSLPKVEPGTIIEFQFTTRTKNLPIENLFSNSISPYWFQPLVAKDGWRADPVKNFSVNLHYPRSIDLLYEVYVWDKKKPKLKKTRSSHELSWKWKDVPEIVVENSMPSPHEFLPSILVSTDKSWEKIDNWTWAKYNKNENLGSDINNFLLKLKLDKNKSETQKIQAVYAYLQKNVRYVFAHLGRGGYDPHPLSEILTKGYGDCKDQTYLAYTMLKELGIEAYPALVEMPSRGKSDTTLARLIFDHILIWIPENESREAIWLDTTGDNGLFPGVPIVIHDQPVLIIDGKGGRIETVDLSHVKNASQISLQYQLHDKKDLVVNAEITFEGAIEQSMRGWWKSDNNRETSLKQLLNTFFEDSGNYQLTSKVSNDEDLFNPFKINVEYRFDSLENEEKSINLGSSTNQLLRMFGGYSSLQIPDSRKNPYHSHLIFDYFLESVFKVPENYLGAFTQTGDDESNLFFSLKQTGSEIADDKVVKIHFRQPELKLSVSEYKQYYESINNVNDYGFWVVNLQEVSENTEVAIENIEHVSGDSFEHFLALTKNQIESGEFEGALKSAKSAIEIDQKSGEAWYFLGTAQGFMGDIEKSRVSFSKAKLLGYIP